MDRQPSVAPVLMAREAASGPERASGADRIEIVLGNGRRPIACAAIDASALARVVAVLERT